jgi:hypothetical protein
MKSTTRARLFSLLGPAAIVVAGAIVSLAINASARPRITKDSDFWRGLQLYGANEVEQYETLKAMRDSADKVVIGKMVAFEPSRTIQGDAPEDVVTYARADFAISERIRGEASSQIVSVEFLVPQSPQEASGTISAMSRGLPKEPALLFIREKRDGSGHRRLVNSRGLLTKVEGKLTAPVAPQGEGDEFDSETEGKDSVEALARYLASK